MARIDLSDVEFPWVYTATAVDTPLQEFRLPGHCRFTVTCEGEAGVLAFATNGSPLAPELPVDGAAVGTHRQELTADVPYSMRFAGRTRSTRPRSVFVARSATSGSVTIMLEALET